jgi:hypothetical protein
MKRPLKSSSFWEHASFPVHGVLVFVVLMLGEAG